MDLGKDGLRHSFAFENQFGKHRVVADAFPPKILSRDKQAVAVFFGQFDIERCLAQEGVVAQDTLAEAVYGIDGSVVELPDGGFEADNQTRPAFFLQSLFQECGQEGVAFVVFGTIGGDAV